MHPDFHILAERSGIDSAVLQEISTLADCHGMSRVILFGSRARGDFCRTSDIDLAVSGGFIPGFALDVEEETSTLLKFDVVDLDLSVQQELLHSIERKGITIYEKI